MPIHEALQTQDLLPADHLVDTANIDAELLVSSQERDGVNLVDPPLVPVGYKERIMLNYAYRPLSVFIRLLLFNLENSPTVSSIVVTPKSDICNQQKHNELLWKTM